jgi:hypothetical protein
MSRSGFFKAGQRLVYVDRDAQDKHAKAVFIGYVWPDSNSTAMVFRVTDVYNKMPHLGTYEVLEVGGIYLVSEDDCFEDRSTD